MDWPSTTISAAADKECGVAIQGPTRHICRLILRRKEAPRLLRKDAASRRHMNAMDNCLISSGKEKCATTGPLSFSFQAKRSCLELTKDAEDLQKLKVPANPRSPGVLNKDDGPRP
eukprot:4501601-Amphidinium_carterae.1